MIPSIYSIGSNHSHANFTLDQILQSIVEEPSMEPAEMWKDRDRLRAPKQFVGAKPLPMPKNKSTLNMKFDDIYDMEWTVG